MNRLSRTVDRLRLRHPGGPDLNVERHASWHELFFDLVIVLTLLGVTARLDTRPSPSLAQLATAVGLYLLIQWSWAGQSFYDTRYDPDDTPQKLLVLTATLGAGAIAVGVPQVPGGLLLPVGYLVVRGCLFVMYLRVLTLDPSSRDLVKLYLSGFGIGWLLWASSLTVPANARPVFWIVALTIEMLTPWLGRRRLRGHPVHSTHLPERLGQFTIILLSATLTNVRDALPTAHPPARVLLAAALAFVISASIWWLYTTYLTSGLAAPHLAAGTTYAYIHIPGGAAILFLGWSLGVVVHQVRLAHPLPLTIRLVLGGSIITWMAFGLSLQRFSQGHLTRCRVLLAVLGTIPPIAISLLVIDPVLLIGLTAAFFVAYAATISRYIARVRDQQPVSEPPP
jgi:low temperature requirement protein LtrA